MRKNTTFNWVYWMFIAFSGISFVMFIIIASLAGLGFLAVDTGHAIVIAILFAGASITMGVLALLSQDDEQDETDNIDLKLTKLTRE